jgi:[protein-PII] uridylyltransferase
MDKVTNPRAIIDRRALTLALDALGGEGAHGSPEQRQAAVVLLKQALATGRAAVRSRFESGTGAVPTVHAQSFLIDQLIRVVFDFTVNRVFRLPNPTASERLSVVAVGGYGRGELAPFSDIDLLFLRPYKQTPWGEQVVEYMLYLLWDLGLKVGHSARDIDECMRQAKADITVRTALLEARWIWGDRGLFDQMKEKFAAFAASTGPEFVEAKLAERDARHRRMGDSRYFVEPNLKENKGGLRDLHTLFWIAKYLYRADDLAVLIERGILNAEEHKRFLAAHNFLLTVRCHLHYLAGRAEERLTVDVQRELAQHMGYGDHPGSRGVERFMKHYYLTAKDIGDLTRIFAAAIEELSRKKRRFSLPRRKRPLAEAPGLTLDGDRVTILDDEVFQRDPVNLLRLFHIAQARDLDIHPNALRLVRRSLKLINGTLREDEEANRLFMDMLTSRKDPEQTLRRLSEAGVFGRFVPDFGRVIAQTQHDMYHVYTVDEHTVRAIGILSQIEQGRLAEEHPLANDIVHKIVSRRVLYLAVLLHDIAKGRGGDHSVIGEQIAYKLGPRLGLNEAETETTAWLVRWHLAMSAVSFKRDLNDSKTIGDFVHLVQSPERLRLLLVLTVVDIRAVGPNVWNGWKGQLLRDLYYRAEEVLSGGDVTVGRKQRVVAAKETALKLLPELTLRGVNALLKRHYDSYWLSHDSETVARHARLMRDADKQNDNLTLDFRSDRFRAVTEMTLYATDHPGLFARVAGAIAVSGGNIVDAKIFTTTDGMAIDTFYIQEADGSAFDRPERLARLRLAVERTLSGELLPKQAIALEKPGMPTRARVYTVAPVVLIDNNASLKSTVIEVNGRDRPGLLYDVTRALYSLSLSIASAHIATYGERAVDVFYVHDLTGMKVTQKTRLIAIEKRLIDALRTPEERARRDEEGDDAPRRRPPPRRPARAAAE